MYINNDDAEKDLIEQAIKDAEHARNEYLHLKLLNVFAGLKAWLVASLAGRKSKNNAASSSDAPLMS